MGAKMCIVSDNEIPEMVEDLIGSDRNVAVSPSDCLKIFDLCEDAGAGSIFELTDEMTNLLDEDSQMLMLFGMAFEEQWCFDDVLIVLVHSEEKAYLIEK